MAVGGAKVRAIFYLLLLQHFPKKIYPFSRWLKHNLPYSTQKTLSEGFLGDLSLRSPILLCTVPCTHIALTFHGNLPLSLPNPDKVGFSSLLFPAQIAFAVRGKEASGSCTVSTVCYTVRTSPTEIYLQTCWTTNM